jgi:hypothetical protein
MPRTVRQNAGRAQGILRRRRQPIRELMQNPLVHVLGDNLGIIAILLKWLRKKISGNFTKDGIANRPIRNGSGITIIQMLQLYVAQDGRCFYCNTRMKLGVHSGGRQMTLDRLDVLLAHIIGNCICACLNCNRTRQDRSVEAFAAQHHYDHATTEKAVAVAKSIL